MVQTMGLIMLPREPPVFLIPIRLGISEWPWQNTPFWCLNGGSDCHWWNNSKVLTHTPFKMVEMRYFQRLQSSFINVSLNWIARLKHSTPSDKFLLVLAVNTNKGLWPLASTLQNTKNRCRNIKMAAYSKGWKWDLHTQLNSTYMLHSPLFDGLELKQEEC